MPSAESSADGAAEAAASPPRPSSPPPAVSSTAAPAPPPASAAPSSSSAPATSFSTTLATVSSASAAASEPSASGSSMHPPGTFSSSPVAPVVANNHHRRWRSEVGWIKPDGDLRRREDSATSPGDASRGRARPTGSQRSRLPSYGSSKSDTSDEDIRAPRGASEPVSAAGNDRSPSLPSASGYRGRSTGESSDQRDQVAGQDGRESNQQQARRSRSRSPEDEPSERRAYQESGKASSYEDGSRTPSPVDRDVRILFKGREVFADDLIGLRVAKTFAGHGRFLGQVVKFDGPTSLYTVVYADGDAEDLSVENTIQILIQDEIERVDPSLPPPANSLFFKREGASLTGVDSPNGTESSDMMASGAQYRHQRSQSGGSEHRSVIRISDREAQFVIGLFENHALPILLQQGWRVQSNPSGGEARYVAPGVGDGFSSSGAVFRSALDVVEYIASDNELLTACFPMNVHSAILSLLSDSNHRQSAESTASLSSSGVRKRGTAEFPAVDGFGSKRHRQPRDEMYGSSVDARRMPPTTASPRIETAIGGHAYRSAELEYRAREREAAMRQGMPAERFASVDPVRAGAPIPNTRQSYYSSAEYRGGHSRHLSDGSVSSSRWSGEPPVAPVVEKPSYHRRYEESPRWRERDTPARSGYYASEPPSADAVPRNYPRAERYYEGERTLMRPSFRGTRGELPPDYRYQGQAEAALGVPTDAYRHRYADTPPHRGSFADGRQVDGVVDPSAGRLPRDAAGLNATGTHRMRRDSPAISMMDVDRLTNLRGAGRGEQPANRSPRSGVDASAAHASFPGQYGSQRGVGSHYGVETGGPADMDTSSDAPVPQDEERAV